MVGEDFHPFHVEASSRFFEYFLVGRNSDTSLTASAAYNPDKYIDP